MRTFRPDVLALLLVVSQAACGDAGAAAEGEGGGGGDAIAAGGGGGASSGGGAGGASPGDGGEAGASSGSGSGGGSAEGTGGAGPSPAPPPDDAPNPEGYASADAWNFPNDNYFVCGKLKGDSAPLRYGDFAPIGASGAYAVTNDLSSDECGPGRVRFDLHEVLETPKGRLYFHKGGQGYENPKPPYGHLWIADLESPAPKPQVSGEPPEYGAPSKIPGTDQWDWKKRNGRGCEPDGVHDYRARIAAQGTEAAIPKDWQYKPNQTSSRFDKYADAGAEQGDGSEHYAYLLWSWLHRGDGETTSKGGGMVRALVREGQVFRRCRVRAIDSVAYAKGSGEEAGRVTAIYGMTRPSAEGPWVYGWTIHSHRAKLADGTYGPRVHHFERCASPGC